MERVGGDDKAPKVVALGACAFLGSAGSPDGALTVHADGFDSRALHAPFYGRSV